MLIELIVLYEYIKYITIDVAREIHWNSGRNGLSVIEMYGNVIEWIKAVFT